MKKYISISFAIVGVLLLASCESRLDLQPQQSISTNLAFADKRSAEGSLIGVYSAIQDLEVFGAVPQTIADYQADNVEFIGTFPTFQEIFTFVTLSDNSSIRDVWRDNYKAILAANAVIKNVPGVEDPSFSATEKAQFIAEAKFLRAITYFNLANLFAQPVNIAGESSPGLPLVLDAFEGEVTLPSRSTIGEVHTQIKKDLEEALADLPDTHPGEFMRGRATKGAARGMLSRLALYRGEYPAAATLAESVISSPSYALASNYSFFNGLTSEDVFTVIMTAIDNSRTGTGGWASFYFPAERGARGDCPISQNLIEAYQDEAGDKRFTELTTTGANGFLYSTKFSDAVTNTDNAPVMRITEMYLTAAEALAEQNGVNQRSIDLINPLRLRAGLAAWSIGDFQSKEELVSAILNERRKELAFEGHRRMDLLRKNLPLRAAGLPQANVAQPGADKTILPIPQREIDLNKSLTQNKGYSN
jgi:hypothetical protein